MKATRDPKEESNCEIASNKELEEDQINSELNQLGCLAKWREELPITITLSCHFLNDQ
jgi:hypothetical protein